MPLQQAEAAVFLHHLLCIDCSCLKASCDATSSINQVDYVCSAESTLHLQDTTFEMERQRNKPVKYNRELVHKSVKAMQKVEEVCSSTILNSKSSLQQGPSAACMRQTCKTAIQIALDPGSLYCASCRNSLTDCFVSPMCRFGWQDKIDSMRLA